MTITKEKAIEVAAELWVGSSADAMRASEYLRGQVELIADLFGHDWAADPDRESLLEAIVAKASS